MAQQHRLRPDSGKVGVINIYFCNNSLDKYLKNKQKKPSLSSREFRKRVTFHWY